MSNRIEAAHKLAGKVFGTVHGSLLPQVICDHGEGVYLFDQDGKRYIDFSGGPHVVSIGHGDKRVREAMMAQMEKVSFFFRGFWLNESLLALADRIIKVSPPNLELCQFCNSGSEANETAIKVAYQYHVERGNPEKYMVISRWQSYHGMTLGALSASGHTARRLKFIQLLHQWPKIGAPLCYRCPYQMSYPGCNIRCAWALEEIINQVGSRYVSAFMAESIGGAASACMVPVPEYYPIIREICDRHDVLFIDDEIICGFGRTGKWFGIEHWEVNPDILTSAKGMTGGYAPMAVTIIDGKIGEVFTQKGASFIHGFTMEGNPVSATACLTVLDIIEKEGLIERSARLGEYFFRRGREKLSHHPSVGDIRGKGLLMGIELVKNRETKEPFDPALRVANRMQQIAMQKGCMGYPTTGVDNGVRGDHFLVSPPFIITESEIDTAFDMLDDALTDLEKEFL
ncbi:MAG: aspartate aminotransferase family protein [Dehalococcoidales bacterium]|mgnify:CR=1 FL=1|jgi:adenosylmethionine-8-amino-7-oxononanoate aminotransferase|nr:aspartate aminotransferase family protein [Dehalococcoidales bacterium]MDP6448492.1 aminotransferase class III-fold pyridoxal phosphate-dependent enzyme [Dehalococcoidales bacterium]MDP6577515.1 aminotransferase class III-fold pyridoxal phosphate-dependent enzyme [Dehalococcoidales bacterium]|tara:strand:+ start:841 stop:2208 length:1368 start_codon:yes stop_codon:yes gene_type:complete